MELNVRNNPVLFPKLSFYVIERGYKLLITGRKRADFKLAEYLLLAADGENLPDVAVFDVGNKRWKEYHSNDVEITSEYAGCVHYKTRGFKPELLLAYVNFIALHSSASFDIE